jgi:hypothetical protein
MRWRPGNAPRTRSPSLDLPAATTWHWRSGAASQRSRTANARTELGASGWRAISMTSSPATQRPPTRQKDPVKLRRYLNVLALNNAGTPSDTSLYRTAGVNAKTAAGYDQLLRNLYVLDIVPAWTSNRLKRIVKQGKRYIVDSGPAAAAAGLDAATILSDPDLVGRCFDAFATSQLRPEIATAQPRQVLHHFRSEAGRREAISSQKSGRHESSPWSSGRFRAGSERRQASVLVARRVGAGFRRRRGHPRRARHLRAGASGLRSSAMCRLVVRDGRSPGGRSGRGTLPAAG